MPSCRVLGVLAVAVPAAIAAALLLPHSPAGLRDLLIGLGPAAPLIALLAWALLVPVLFPGTVLAATGGLAFGSLGGAAIAVVGAVIGGLIAFVLARTSAREAVERRVARSARLSRAHEVVERRGFAAVLAARLMPGVPAGGLHYVAGVSPVGVGAFTAAIALGALLRTVPYVLLGEALVTGSLATFAIAGASIVTGGLAAGVLFRQIRRPLPSVAA